MEKYETGMTRRQVIIGGATTLVCTTTSHSFAGANSNSFDMRNIVAQPIDGGYSWTLPSRLGHMLREAEGQFGQRDKNFTILGIEFSQDGPQHWYPWHSSDIIIQLSLEAMNDVTRACFQLAHEVIHLLSPTGGRNANNLEEGIAQVFSEEYALRHCQSNWHANLESYKKAGAAVRELLGNNPKIIKEVREQEPTISKIQPDLLLKFCPSLNKEIAGYLCKKFIR